MKSHICPERLWRAILWVQWHYSQAPDETKRERPQRPYQPDDGKYLSELIKQTRHAYWQQKQAGHSANFTSCKESALTLAGYDERTRNFYSSVISTYIAWSRFGIPAAILPQVRQIEKYVAYVAQHSS